MDLHQLHCFVSVAQNRGFRRGAEALRIAQPAVSRHIKRLETEFGQALFHRSSTGVELTEAGEVLLDRSQELFERIGEIRDELAAMGDGLSGTVTVGGASSIGEILFAPLADRIRQEFPNVHLSVLESGCRLPRLLEVGEIDLAVLSCPWRIDGHGWESQPLFGETTCLVGPRETFANKSRITLARVLDLPLILSPPPNAQRLKLAYEAQRLNRSITVVAESESVHGQEALVRRGLGFSVLPYSAARLMGTDQDIAMWPIANFFTWRTMIWRTGRRPTRAEVAVRQLIVREMESLAGTGAFGPPVRSPLPAAPKGNSFPA